MVTRGFVKTINGIIINVKADTICLHGDNARAVLFARALRTAFIENGVEIVSPNPGQ
jgi:UPF0271 protein